ncbi:Fe-S cluster assembly protein SufD [Clostridium polynesiense]|uniref:Fe-S cluster assembly protein SufD n=1 Tax=Clostridium polynesiense TaxID=1325933 RepID=UPI00058DF6A5|nr:Fe-S cluster assembly protein SufD [Clostridium polynesiense]
MQQSIFENINKIPVRTYKWLQVNDITLKNIEVPEIKPYKKDYLPSSSNLGVTVQSSLNNIKFLNYNKDFEYGVGDELTKMSELSSNCGMVVQSVNGIQLTEPIVAEFTADKDNEAIVDSNLIIAEENSSFTVVLQYKSEKDIEAFHNGMTKIYAKAGSRVNVIKIQTLNNESNHFDASFAIVEGNAEVNIVSIELGAKNSITSSHTYLVGDNAAAHADTMYLGSGKRYIDMNYVMSHRGRRSRGNILTKGVLLDQCEKIFRGTIDFQKGAVRSKGREEEYCMLLSPKAKSDAVPLLLCEEDDVEGEHAASAGRIDESQLFYLMSRGFDEKEAKRIFIEASFAPILDKIPIDSLRDNIKSDIKGRIENE